MDAGAGSIKVLFCLLLVACGAYFASAESAYARANKIRLKNLSEDGNKKAKKALYIANHFDDIGVDPSLRVADEAETKLLMQDAMAELMEEKHAQADPEFIRCLECFATGKNEKNFEEMILKIYQFAMSSPWPEEWLEESLKVYKCQNFQMLNEMKFVQELLAQVRGLVEECLELYKKALLVCEEPDGPYMYAELLETEYGMMESLKKATSYEQYSWAFSSLDFGRLPAKKDDAVATQKREYIKNLRNEVKEQLIQKINEYFGNYNNFVDHKK